MRDSYIYGLKDPRTGLVRYVGKSVDPRGRLMAHLRAAARGDAYRDRWIRTLLALGLKPELVILEGPCKDWEEAERRWIAQLKPQLTNLTSGGDGLHDLVRTPAHCAAIGRANKRREYTPEMRANISKAQQVRFAKLTEEERQNLRFLRGGARGRWKQPMSAQGRANIAAAKLGTKASTKAKAKMSAAHKARKGNPTWQAQQDQNSLRMKRLWKDPEYRARHIAALKAVELPRASCVRCRRVTAARSMEAHLKACQRKGEG